MDSLSWASKTALWPWPWPWRGHCFLIPISGDKTCGTDRRTVQSVMLPRCGRSSNVCCLLTSLQYHVNTIDIYRTSDKRWISRAALLTCFSGSVSMVRGVWSHPHADANPPEYEEPWIWTVVHSISIGVPISCWEYYASPSRVYIGWFMTAVPKARYSDCPVPNPNPTNPY